MKNEDFESILEIEKSLIELYQRINNIAGLTSHKHLFKEMITQSTIHYNRVTKSAQSLVKPTLNYKAINNVNEKIKNTLRDRVVDSQNKNQALLAMAEAERQTGQLYRSISSYYKKLAHYYQNIHQEIEAIADEEFQHEKIIMDLME